MLGETVDTFVPSRDTEAVLKEWCPERNAKMTFFLESSITVWAGYIQPQQTLSGGNPQCYINWERNLDTTTSGNEHVQRRDALYSALNEVAHVEALDQAFSAGGILGFGSRVNN